MRVKTHHLAAFFFTGALVLASLAWLSVRAPTALATCSTGASISLTSPPAGGTLSGSTTLTATTSGSSAQPSSVTFMTSAPSQIALGDVGPSGPGGTTWSLSWDSRSLQDGGYQFVAVAHYGNVTTYDCLSAPVQATIYNSTAGGSGPSLSASISPGSWQGKPGQAQNFSVTGVYTDQFGVQHPITASSGASYQWGTNAGSLSSNGSPSTTLIDGPATGTFNIGVVVKMNGLSVSKSVPVKISLTATGTSGSGSGGPTPVPTPPPAINSGGQLTPQQLQALSTMPTIFHPASATNSDPVVPAQTLGCLEQKLGAKFGAISSGQAQPSTSDRVAGADCFSGSNKIPASLAPVEPAHVAELPTADSVTIKGLKNETISGHSGSKVTAILVSGTGTPNASIFLYIFSDPMVLRAQTNSQGQWNYVLENPLKPGHHEFYAVSQTDSSNFVRTPAVPVSIAAASPGSTDGSLIIEHSLSPAQISYILGAGLMVFAGLFLLWRLRRRAKAAPAAVAAAPPVMPASPPASAPPPAPPATAPAVVTDPTTMPEHHDPQA
jgi:hypothetical protein